MLLRSIRGTFKTTPTTALGTLVEIDPLHMTIKPEAVEVCSKIGASTMKNNAEKNFALLRRRWDDWFTDGSVGPDGTSAEFYKSSSGTSYTIDMESLANFFQSKLMVMVLCVHNARDIRDSKVTLHSENTQSRLVWNPFASLNRLTNNGRITLLWIPSNSKYRDNNISLM